ncbi:MAG: Do family serine endopeptidase [Gammaproteobacteria bacterium]|nr:Do family serine endopeptidase [Gammaproteobacteria bacterium]
MDRPQYRYLIFAALCLPVVLYAAWLVAVDSKKLPSLAPMLKLVSPAVVNISSQPTVPSGNSPLLKDPDFRQFYDRLRPSPSGQNARRALGSGTIVDAKNGYILTNQHVIDGGDSIRVVLKNGQKLIAKLIGADTQTDLALLQVNAKGLTEIPFADSNALEVGDFVVAIGSPYGLTQTVTSGIVSALRRSQLGFQGFENFIQTDAATNPGNSGGPLVNLRGELVGVNTAILSPRGSNVGIGFAIPSNMAKAIMSQIIKHGGVKRGVFGVNVQDLSYAFLQSIHAENLKGALVSEIKAASPAQRSGLRVGDIVTAFNGEAVYSANHLHNLLGLMRMGDAVKLGVFRDGFALGFTANIADPYEKYIAGVSISLYLEGARLSNFASDTDGDRSIGLGSKREGIAVGDITVGSSAWRVGLREGDIVLQVNKTPVTSLNEAKQLLKNDKPMFHLRLLRQGEYMNLISPS